MPICLNILWAHHPVGFFFSLFFDNIYHFLKPWRTKASLSDQKVTRFHAFVSQKLWLMNDNLENIVFYAIARVPKTSAGKVKC